MELSRGRGLPSTAVLTLGFLGLAMGGLTWGSQAQAGCGAAAGACEVAQGSYHIALPETEMDVGATLEKRPAVVFLHGYGGSGAGSLNNKAMVRGLTARGYAVIAPDALPARNGNRSWNFFPGWQGRDEVEFLQMVAVDAAEQFDLNRDEMVLAGFSAGGFMVNYLACASPEAFAAYAPVSGGFWRPQPDSCAGPVRLFHSHGWSDGVVPLEGRYLGGGRFQQGDIFAGLELWRQTNLCREQAPGRAWQEGALLRRRWACAPAADIEFLLFPQGHQVPADWADWMLDWFEAKAPTPG